MQGRFEIRLAEGERGDLRECAAHAGLSEAALHDMVGLIAAEPLPLAEKLQLLGDLLAFEGRLTIRRQIEPAQTSSAFQKTT
jgi:hypothetical protein